jgi:hypothetical protein
MSHRLLAASAFAALMVGAASGTAGAAPTGAKNVFLVPATCDGRSVTLVVNNANGQGQGTENNEKGQANFAPAHILGSREVLLPLVFDLQFTFTSPDGESFSFTNTASHGSREPSTTCSIDYSQTDPEGGTFSIVGTVGGRFVAG